MITLAKARARRLRQYLASTGVSLGHSQCLEAIAVEDGFKDWNTCSAHLNTLDSGVPYPPVRVGDRVRGTYRGGSFAGTVLGLEKTDGGPPQIEPVWRIKIQFDSPVSIDGPESLALTRQRIRAMINGRGQSVNLKGRPDGHLALTL
jgi:hypothetical protein